MKTQYVHVGTLLAVPVLVVGLLASGCFGSDPNENSATLCAVQPGIGNCPVSGSGGDGSTSSSSSGGSSGSGGSSSSGGDGGPTAPIIGCPLATFDTDAGNGLQGMIINAYHDTGTTINLADPTLMFATLPMLSWDGAVGSPLPGSLALLAPYTGSNQYVDLQNTSMFGTAHPQDWRGAKLHVRVRAEGTFVGGVQPYVDTTTGYVFGGTHANFTSGVPVGNNWRDFTVNITSPLVMNAGYDPTKVIVYGLQVTSDQAGASQRSVTFHIDSISVEGLASCPTPAGALPDAGASDASDGGAPANDSASAVDAPDAE